MSQTHAVPQKQAAPIRFIRTFIEGNYLYLISTFLMVLGCYRLVRSALLTGDEYTRTVYSLCVLQAYEILVIATAALIVRRFKALNDAFSLLLIELVLLLDPTFFSNSFITLFTSHSAATNIVTLVLVPVKLILVQRLTGVRPGGRYNCAFLLAAISVYAAAWPLAYYEPWLTRYGYYYFVGVQVLLIAAMMPSYRNLWQPQYVTSEFSTPRQAAWLPFFLIAIPLVVAAAHYIECSRIHNILFYPANLVPLVLAVAVLILANTPRDERYAKRIYAIDALAVLSVVLSLPALNTPTAADLLATGGHEPWLYKTSTPLLVGGAEVVLVYIYALGLGWRKQVVRRAQIAFAVTVCYLVYRSGVVGWMRRGAVHSWDGLVHQLSTHPLIGISVVWALSVAVAWRFRWAVTWAVCGIMTIILVAFAAPAGSLSVAELAEAFFLLALVVSHRFSTRDTPASRYVVAAVIVGIATYRFKYDPSTTTTAIALALPVLGCIAGIWLKHYGYVAIAAAQTAACLVILMSYVRAYIHPAVAAIAGGLMVFALAVLVTFKKSQILAQLEPLPMYDVSAMANNEKGEASDVTPDD